MVKFTYEKIDPDYDHEEVYTEISESNLRRARNAYFLMGFGVGVVFTVIAQYVFLWVINVI